MKHLLCCLLIGLSCLAGIAAARAEIPDSEVDQVRDLLYMKAQQWHAAQGQSGTDYASLQLLQGLNQGDRARRQFLQRPNVMHD